MGDLIIVLSDEATCAGFRLAGVAARSPTLQELPAAFEQAWSQAQLVVLSQRLAQALPPQRLAQAQASQQPWLVVMPEFAAPGSDDGLARRMRAVLGIEA